MWHQRGIPLEQSVYHLVCASLKDDYEGVRLTAVNLVCVFCQIYPEQLVTLHSLPSCWVRLTAVTLVWVFCQIYPEQSVTLQSLPSVDVVHDSLVAYGATEMCFDISIGGLIDGLVVGWLVDL